MGRAGGFILLVLAWMLHAGPSQAYVFSEHLPPAYASHAQVMITEGVSETSDKNPDEEEPYAEAYAQTGQSWARTGRGSHILFENEYTEPDGSARSTVSVHMEGFSKGELGVTQGFILERAESTADYMLILSGGTGSTEAGLFFHISETEKPYPTLPAHSITLFDNLFDVEGNLTPETSWRRILYWEDGDPLDPVSLPVNEPFLLRAASGVNVSEMGGFDYESQTTFCVEVVEPPVPIPLPSSFLLLASVLLAVQLFRSGLRTRCDD